MEPSYYIIKRDDDGKIYYHIAYSSLELVEHLSACFRYTNHDVLSVTLLPPSTKERKDTETYANR